ncbi:helix-turn-helix domain-containing protein [Leptothoe sp. ISB3NOV94-8A]
MQTPKTVRIYTRLLDHGHECGRLWTLLRALDTQGRGWVLFDYAEIANLMGVSVRTVQRWVSQGLTRGWFRGRRWMDSQIELYLSGIRAVKNTLGVDGLGAIADVSIDHLGRSEAKALCTALEAQYRQRQAYWAARKAKKGQAKKSVLKPWEMATSDKLPGENSLVVVSNGFQIPGCSIAGLAKATDWSQSTIKRRLSNRWRLDRDIEPIQKKRVATELDDPELLFLLRESGCGFLVTENVVGHTRVLKVLNDEASLRLVSLGCNIYAQSHELRSCRSLRRRVKRMLAQDDVAI